MLRLSVPLGTLLLAFLFGGPVCHAQQQDSTSADRPRQTANEWIGTRYPPLPRGVTYHGGDSMDRGGSRMEDSSDENYSISIISAHDQQMVWMNRIVGRTTEGRAKKVVTDVLVPPEVPDDYTLEFGICGTLDSDPSRGQPEPSEVTVDPEMITVVRKGKTKVLTEVRRAWRADQDTGRFREIQPHGIVCLNDALVGH